MRKDPVLKLSCGIVPVRRKSSDWEYLILRCYKNWDFPKGMKDPHETPLTAARREFFEETHLENVTVPSPDMFVETEAYSHGKIARYYLGIVEGGDEIKLLPNPITGILEHHEFRWASASEAEALLVPRLKNVLAWAKNNLESV